MRTLRQENGDASLYELLGVGAAVTPAEIRHLRRDLARRYHPDVAAQPDALRLARVLGACEVLGDPARKARYDAKLRRAGAAAAGTGGAGVRIAPLPARPPAPARWPAGARPPASARPSAAARWPAAARPPAPARRPAPARAPRRGPRFDWDGSVTRALCYALGAATVPGYLTAFVIGGWLTPASVLETSTHPVFINGPILIVLAVQAVLAATLSILHDIHGWRCQVLRSQARTTE